MNDKKMSLRLGTHNLSTLMLCIYIASLAISYIPGFAINSVSLYGFVIVAIVEIASSGKIVFERPAKWYGFFLLVSALSLVYTPSIHNGYKVFESMIIIFVMIVLVGNVLNSYRKVKYALFSYSVSTMILLTYMLTTNQLFGFEQRLGTTITGNANAFATIFLMGAISSIFFVFNSNSFLKRIIWFSILAAQELAIVLSGGRKYFFLPLILLLTLFVIESKRNGHNRIIIRVIIVICILLFVFHLLMNVSFFYDAIGYRFDSLFSGIQGGEYDGSAQVRIDMIKAGIVLWESSPIIGNGINSFEILSQFGSYAHNNYVELLCDFGVVGFLSFYSYYLSIIWSFKEFFNTNKWFWFISILCFLIFDSGAVTYYLFPIQLMTVIGFYGMKWANQQE